MICEVKKKISSCKQSVEAKSFCAVAKRRPTFVFYNRFSVGVDKRATSDAQRFGSANEHSEIESCANRLNADFDLQLSLRKHFEAIDIVFIGDKQQIACERHKSFVDCSRLYVANKLTDRLALEILNHDMICLRLAHVARREHLAKHRRA